MSWCVVPKKVTQPVSAEASPNKLSLQRETKITLSFRTHPVHTTDSLTQIEEKL